MQPELPKNRSFAREVFVFVFWTILFAVAYSQSPLYTSNQNQYFLHGLAHAGFGNLGEDWLANTPDPTPVFSALVEWTYRLTHLELLYYGYYALLMSVYLFSLLGIADQLSGGRLTGSRWLVLAALLFVVHSAGWRFSLSRVIGVNWTYLLEDGVADQRMLGPVLQPSAFGVLLALSIWLFMRRRLHLAALAVGLAAVFHPTYLLSAATLTAVYLLVTVVEERDWLKAASAGLLATLVVSPALFLVVGVFGGTNPQLAAQARQVLVDFRIPHHAVVSQWLDATVAGKALLVLGALFAVRRSRLFWVLLASTLVASGGTLARVWLDSDTLALLFPWRLSIYIVPISTTVLLAGLATRVVDTSLFRTRRARRWLELGSIALIALAVVSGGARFYLDVQRKASEPERAVQAYVAQHKESGEVYLTPVKMQDFRLASGAPAYIDFKSIPYKDSDVLEWYRRERLADRFYKSGDCGLLAEMARQEEVTHVVLESGSPAELCPQLEMEFKGVAHDLYRIQSP